MEYCRCNCGWDIDTNNTNKEKLKSKLLWIGLILTLITSCTLKDICPDAYRIGAKAHHCLVEAIETVDVERTDYFLLCAKELLFDFYDEIEIL